MSGWLRVFKQNHGASDHSWPLGAGGAVATFFAWPMGRVAKKLQPPKSVLIKSALRYVSKHSGTDRDQEWETRRRKSFIRSFVGLLKISDEGP